MRRLFYVIIVLVSCSGFAQIQIQGVVKDSIGNPLELANVIAINKATSTLESFGITNDQGKYKLSLKANTTYTVQVSYVGMKTAEQEITTTENALTQDFTLQSDNMLDAVELVYEMPVTISGDTIVYNADSFNTGSERKLEDVLKNLPGIEVTDDGEIEVEGKTVGKVMVEGKDFFDGDSKLATKNIPANAVDKVQVLKNYSEVGQLSGVTNNQDNIAINIKLKEGKTNFWFGVSSFRLHSAHGFHSLFYLPLLFQCFLCSLVSLHLFALIAIHWNFFVVRRDFFTICLPAVAVACSDERSLSKVCRTICTPFYISSDCVW